MRKIKLLPRYLIVICLLFSSCSGSVSPTTSTIALTTAGGAATGAMIGAMISNGDVAMSALLGGAIGLPIGIALAIAMQHNSEAAEEQAKIAFYLKNQELIIQREKEIEALREEVLTDYPRGNPDRSMKKYIYRGQSLGNAYR